MVILAGPSAPLNGVVTSMLRTGMSDPFEGLGTGQLGAGGLGTGVGPVTDPKLAIMAQIVRVLMKLTAALESMHYRPAPPEDDFMKGWGEPGGDLD